MKKIQFNVETGKDFRKVASKAHHAWHVIKDQKKLAAQAKSGKEAEIALQEQTLERIKNGEKTLTTQEAVEKNIALYQAQIKALADDIADMERNEKKNITPATDLVTDDLYQAYADWCMIKTDDKTAYAQAIATWFKAQGFADATAENCECYTGFVARTTDARSYETGHLTKAEKKATFATKFMKGLVDVLQDAGVINAYKYKYVAPSKQKKQK